MIKVLEFLFNSIWHFLGLLLIIHVAKNGLTTYQNGIKSIFKGIYKMIGKAFIALRGK